MKQDWVWEARWLVWLEGSCSEDISCRSLQISNRSSATSQLVGGVVVVMGVAKEAMNTTVVVTTSMILPDMSASMSSDALSPEEASTIQTRLGICWKNSSQRRQSFRLGQQRHPWVAAPSLGAGWASGCWVSLKWKGVTGVFSQIQLSSRWEGPSAWSRRWGYVLNLGSELNGEGSHHIVEPCLLAGDLLVANCASTCVNHRVGSAGQKGGGLIDTATTGVGIGCGGGIGWAPVRMEAGIGSSGNWWCGEEPTKMLVAGISVTKYVWQNVSRTLELTYIHSESIFCGMVCDKSHMMQMWCMLCADKLYFTPHNAFPKAWSTPVQCVLYLATMQADQIPDNCDMTGRLQQALWAETLVGTGLPSPVLCTLWSDRRRMADP